MPISIIIVGGGLAGLTAARALAPAGHRIRLYERSSDYDDQGWNVALQPPSLTLLASWGIDRHALNPVQMDSLWRRRYGNVAELGDVDLAYLRKEYGVSHPEWIIERRDLLYTLRDLLRSFSNVTIQSGLSVDGVDLDRGRVRLSNGDMDRADIVIGADGVHSIVYDMFPPTHIRKHISHATRSPQHAAHCVLRTSVGLQDPVVRAHLLNIPFRSGAGIYTDDDQPDLDLGVFIFPAQSGELLEISILRRDEAAVSDTGAWRRPISSVEFYRQARCNLLADPLRRMVQVGEQHTRFFVGIRDSPLSFTHGKGVLIGDAAHVVHPSVGAGASLSIEDAFCLGFLLENAEIDDLPQRLPLFDELRYERCLRIKYSEEWRPEGTGTSAEMLNHLVPGARIPDREEEMRLRWIEDVEKKTRAKLKAKNLETEPRPSLIERMWQEIGKMLCMCGPVSGHQEGS